jgi:hypothetical protein
MKILTMRQIAKFWLFDEMIPKTVLVPILIINELLFLLNLAIIFIFYFGLVFAWMF